MLLMCVVLTSSQVSSFDVALLSVLVHVSNGVLCGGYGQYTLRLATCVFVVITM